MIITVKMKDGERQKPIVTIDTETCLYPYAIMEALEFKISFGLQPSLFLILYLNQ